MAAENKYLVDHGDGTVTGLKDPQTRKKAEEKRDFLVARGDIATGEIITRAKYEASAKGKAEALDNKRGGKALETLAVVQDAAGSDYETVLKHLGGVDPAVLNVEGALNLALAQKSKDMMDFVAGASEAELDAYDPTTEVFPT